MSCVNLALLFRNKRVGANSIEGVFEAIDSQLAPHTSFKLPYTGGDLRAVFRNMLFVWRLRNRENNPVWHITGDIHYATCATGHRTVLTVHDVGSAFTGNFFSQLYKRIVWFIIPILIAKRISVISEATRKDLVRIAPWAKRKITVIPDPYNIVFEGRPKEGMGDIPRILHIGTKPNKNLERVIQALRNVDCTLVIVGRLSEQQMGLIEATGISCINLVDIPIEELVEEYRKCDIVSFPSTFEGFGMPIIEAQAACRPVIAGDIPVLRDVAGEDGAVFINPYDVDSIRSGFLQLIDNVELRHRLVNNGSKNKLRFRPEVIAAMYNKIYEEL